MKKNINLLGIALIMFSFFAFSGLNCESTGTELRIIGTNNKFSGYYIINGNKEEHIDKDDIHQHKDSKFYVYRKDLGTFRFVEITVNKEITDTHGNLANAMDIYLYDANGNLLQKVNNSACSSLPFYTTCTNTASSTMSYTYRSGN